MPDSCQKIEPLKSGKGILKVAFWNTGYVAGVQGFEKNLKLLHRATNYLVAGILHGNADDMEQCAVVSHIEFAWIEKFCPELWHNHPPHQYDAAGQISVTSYLNAVFGVKS